MLCSTSLSFLFRVGLARSTCDLEVTETDLAKTFLGGRTVAKKKNPHAVALGKMGGSKGGKTRAARLTPERRQEIARKAVLARWAKHKKRLQPS